MRSKIKLKRRTKRRTKRGRKKRTVIKKSRQRRKPRLQHGGETVGEEVIEYDETKESKTPVF